MLSDIDQALRYAKERLHEWFGGLIVIFSGDFYQFPPVSGSPLYQPVSQHSLSCSSKELQKRLGRLAWRSLTDVVELTEQQRMKDDPVYAQAVLHLRERVCNTDDVDLFNSRIIKGVDHPEGVDMADGNNHEAIAVVTTNLSRIAVNNLKAESYCNTRADQTLIQCAAKDTVNGVLVPNVNGYMSRDELLQMDVSGYVREGALLGYLPCMWECQ